VDPPRIEPYETLQALTLHPGLASFAVRDRITGAPATLWLGEQPLPRQRVPAHTHLLEVYGQGIRDGYEYVVTEPVHETLRTILAREGVLSSERAIAVAVGVARGLSQLLAAGLHVGRITPSDVAVGLDGTPKVIPFTLPTGEAPAGDALLRSLGGLYYEMLTGRPPRADDPLAAASTEILRSLVTSSLARERIEQLPGPAELSALPAPDEPRPGLPSLATILRWSGVASAIAVAAIVLGVRASLNPTTMPGSQSAPPAAVLPPAATAPRITERPPSRAGAPRRFARAVPVQPARTVHLLQRARTAAGLHRSTPATRTAARLPVTVTAPVPLPTRVAKSPPVAVGRPNRRPLLLSRTVATVPRQFSRREPARAYRAVMARLPSPAPVRERVLAEPPADYREPSPTRYVSMRREEAVRAPSVRLKVVLDAEGRPETALVVRSSGDPRCDQAAVRAAREMRFDAPRGHGDGETGRRGGVAYMTLAVPNADFPGLVRPVPEFP
jgi:TonB family protein